MIIDFEIQNLDNAVKVNLGIIMTEKIRYCPHGDQYMLETSVERVFSYCGRELRYNLRKNLQI